MTLRTILEEAGFEDDVLSILEDNDVNLEVFKTMNEVDFREVGLSSFGVRRKLKLLIGKLTTNCEDTNTIPEVPSCSTTNANTNHDSDSDSDVIERNPKKMRSSYSGINFNLEKEMSASVDGRALMNKFKTGSRPTGPERRVLVRVAVASLVKLGIKGLWPTSLEKTNLAKCIVKTFPSTIDTTEGMQGHEHYYANGKGFIEYRLKTIRNKEADPNERRARWSQPSPQPQSPEAPVDDLLVSEVEQEQINWMKYSPLMKENQAKHYQYFKDTFKYRRSLIENSQEKKTVTDILETFPRFKDIPELINLEFGIMYADEQDNFLKKWTKVRDSIISIGKDENPAVQELIKSFENGNKDLCGLSTLLYLLHRSVNRKKGDHGSCSRAGAILHLIQNKPGGTDVAAAVSLKGDDFRQPFLLSLGPTRNPTQYFVVVDRIPLTGGLDLIQAFDMLFKCHYVFQVDYSPVIQPFWEFVDSMIYRVMKSSQAKPQVRELGSAVRANMK